MIEIYPLKSAFVWECIPFYINPFKNKLLYVMILKDLAIKHLDICRLILRHQYILN
ncbi:hypothetical protein JOD45_001642 [Scopulibacillus daqui]|uniref:Uncharacterized protein n=1 Tax=Scopulibacillus daqui TaxID=1469162 RepID=A0ABS2PZP1_9BACL|nr:hypothetical protein [Scopulibacillus daqui]